MNAPYMTVYVVNSLPKIPNINRMCMVLANPTYTYTVYIMSLRACVQYRPWPNSHMHAFTWPAHNVWVSYTLVCMCALHGPGQMLTCMPLRGPYTRCGYLIHLYACVPYKALANPTLTHATLHTHALAWPFPCSALTALPLALGC
jgi:hypothetical protein